MKILGIEHVAIVTESLEEAKPFWRDVLGISHHSTEIVESEGVKTDIYETGRGKIELLERVGEDSAITRFLEKRGEGIHHICLEVEDISVAIRELRRRGIRLINENPRIGAEGYSVVFIHPESTGGVLVELCQRS